MEKNDFLLYNEIIYHIHTCQDMDDLKRSILAQVKLMIPYTYASLIVVEIDPETREIRHSDPFCLPDSFTALEEAWIDRDHQDESFWVSHAPESIVVRSSDLTGEARLESPIFQELYQQYNIYDTMSMNLAYDHQVMALLTLYRTRRPFISGHWQDMSTMPITPWPSGRPASPPRPGPWRSWSKTTN